MFAFVVYAVVIWYAAARFRRQWESFAWVAGGLAGLLLVAWLHTKLSDWTDGRIFLPVLRSLLYPYTALVVAVGLFIACLPVGRVKVDCPTCDYDLRGLEDEVNSCPECGTPFMMEAGRPVRVWADPLPVPPTAAPGGRCSPPRPRRDRQRRRSGPPPVVLHWPPA
jgi:hypothetical protein